MINNDKTKIIIIGKKRFKTAIKLQDKNVEETDSFKYLRVMIQKDNKNEV